MKINGLLTFNADGSGYIQNAFIEQFASDPVGVTGRIYYNTTDNHYYYYNGTSWQQLNTAASAVSSFQTSLSGLTPSSPTTGSITLAGTLGAISGGTGQSAYTTGDILYASSSTALSKLAAGTATQVLHGGTTPSWSAVDLTADVSGILPLANGGTNAALTATAGGVVYGTGSALAVSAAGTTGQFVLSGGTGSPTFLTNLTPIVDDVGSTDLIVGTTFNFLGTVNQITTTASAQTVTFSLPSAVIAPGSVEVTTDLTIDGLTYESAESNITATGTDQGTAYALTKSYSVVGVTASGTGVSLPASGPGLEVTVINLGANVLAVYPFSGDAIDGAAVDDPVFLPTFGTATYQSVSAGQWYTIDPVLVTSGSGIQIAYGNGETTITNTGVTSVSFSTTGLTPSSPTTGAVVVGGTLVVSNGGTGATTLTNHGVLLGQGTSAVVATSPGTTGQVLTSNGASADPTFQAVSGFAVTTFQTSLSGLTPSSPTSGAVTLAGTLNADSGGTGLSSYTAGDLLYATASATTLSTLAAGTSTQVLHGGTVPSWSAVSLTADVSGVLPLANGGTNANLTAVAGAPVYSTGSALALGTAGSTGQAYISGGTGVPTWRDVSDSITGSEIIAGDGAGAFTAVGGTFTGSGSFSGVTLNGTVTNASDATTKQYVDAVAAGMTWKNAVIVTTAGDGDVDLTTGGLLPIDGVTVADGDRVLVSAQTDPVENGIYIAHTGAWTRSTDMATGSNASGDAMFVEQGTVYGDSAWVQTADPAIVDTDGLTFSQFSGGSVYTFTSGLLTSGSTISVRTDAVTTYIDGSNNVAVKSSATANNVLLSNGTSTTPSWGALPLGDNNAVTGTLAVTHGGTGDTTFTTNGVVYGSGTSPLGVTAAGVAGDVLTGTAGAPVFTALDTIAVTTIDFGSTGLTPATPTSGPVSVAGTLVVGNGGTGVTSLTTNGVLYGGATVGATAAGATGTVLTGTGSAPAFALLDTIAVTSITGTTNQIDTDVSVGDVTLSLSSTLVAPGSVEVTTDLTVDGFSYESTDPAVTAAGTTQATAFVLTKQYNMVTTVNTGVADGVQLPSGLAGLEITIVNVGSGTLKVYPFDGDSAQIDGAAVDAPITIPNGGTWSGQAASNVQWYSVDPVLVAGTGVSVIYGNGETTVSNTGVLSFSAGTTGFTPSSPTAGNIVLAGTLNLASGGTNASLSASNGAVVYSTATALALSAVGTSGYFLTSSGAGAPTWSNPATTVVTSFETDLDGLTPSSPTMGAVTLSGTLGSASGGTGVDNSAGATGTALIASAPGVFTATPIQATFSSVAGDGGAGPALVFICTHNLGQQFVNVNVYDDTFNQIIPQSVELTDANTVTVTVNSAIDVYIVVMGVAGVSLSNPT